MIFLTKSVNQEPERLSSSRDSSRVKSAVTAKVFSSFCKKRPKSPFNGPACCGEREALWTAEICLASLALRAAFGWLPALRSGCLRFEAEPACWRGGVEAMHFHKLRPEQPASHDQFLRRRQASLTQSGNKLPQPKVLRTPPILPLHSSSEAQSSSSFRQIPANTGRPSLYTLLRPNQSHSA